MEEYLNKRKTLERIDAMLSKTCDENGETVPNEWWDSLRKLVEQEKAADVAPVIHAKLIYTGYSGNYECSNCGAVDTKEKKNYCDVCGAKLDKEKDYGRV